jgi:hypothetical protein
VYDNLKDQFELGVEVTLEQMHRDRDRDGKLLGGRRASRSTRTIQPVVATTAEIEAGQ